MKHQQDEETHVKKSSQMNIQDYLSLGYIFLLVLGVFHDTIYYKFLGINILEYSSVLDVLISPVSVIAGNLKLAVALIGAIIFAILYKNVIPLYYTYLSKKKKYQTEKGKAKIEKSQKAIKSVGFTYFMILLMIFSVFTGVGIGRGKKVKSRIDGNEFKLTHELIFHNKKVEKIKLLGKNSLYVFYVTKPKGEILISPIDSNIETIKTLNVK